MMASDDEPASLNPQVPELSVAFSYICHFPTISYWFHIQEAWTHKDPWSQQVLYESQRRKSRLQVDQACFRSTFPMHILIYFEHKAKPEKGEGIRESESRVR